MTILHITYYEIFLHHTNIHKYSIRYINNRNHNNIVYNISLSLTLYSNGKDYTRPITRLAPLEYNVNDNEIL